MAEQLLDDAQVGSSVEEVRRHRVTQRMRVGGHRRPPVDDAADVARPEPERPAVQEDGTGRAVGSCDDRTALVEPSPERLGTARVHGYPPFLGTLSHHRHRARAQVHAGAVEPAELRHAEAGSVEQLEHGVVAQGVGHRPCHPSLGTLAPGPLSAAPGVRAAPTLEHDVQLTRGEDRRKASTRTGGPQAPGRVLGDEGPPATPAEVGPKRCRLAGDARAGVPAGGEVGEVAAEQHTVDCGRTGPSGAGGPLAERLDVAQIGAPRGVGAPEQRRRVLLEVPPLHPGRASPLLHVPHGTAGFVADGSTRALRRRNLGFMGSRILVVEDDERIRSSMRLALEGEGYEIDEAANGEEALELFSDHPADIALIDLMLPGMDGFECCRALRRQSAVPIIIVTARSDTHDVVAGLEAGADDYVTKPFVTKELGARIRALLRRVRPVDDEPTVLAFGDLELVPEEGVLRRKDGTEVHCTKTEFRLLCELASSPNKVLSREQLLDRVWGYDYFGDGRLVDVHIRRLRTKVEPDPALPRHILTVRGMGYKLVP